MTFRPPSWQRRESAKWNVRSARPCAPSIRAAKRSVSHPTRNGKPPRPPPNHAGSDPLRRGPSPPASLDTSATQGLPHIVLIWRQINAGGREAPVAEHALDSGQLGARVQPPPCQAMAQHMGRHRVQALHEGCQRLRLRHISHVPGIVVELDGRRLAQAPHQLGNPGRRNPRLPGLPWRSAVLMKQEGGAFSRGVESG